MSLARRLMFSVVLPLGIPLVALAAGQPPSSPAHDAQHAPPGTLIDKVQNATRRFRDINVAKAEYWMAGTPCVSGPDTGAMGVHFFKQGKALDGELNVDEPEALIYEPLGHNLFRLVAVEYIVIAADWAAKHKDGPPVLEGNLMNFVDAPNRYGLGAFYELHVWAWENNPKGSFADWNTQVNCERQPGD